MGGVKHMSVRRMGVMSRRFVVPRRVVPSGFLMVLHCVLGMLGGLGMMAVRRMTLKRCFLRHAVSPFVAVLLKLRVPPSN
jgi:hypothetical protein